MSTIIDIHPVKFSLTDDVKNALASELEQGGFRSGTLYLGPGGSVEGQCFLLLIGSGRPAFSRASLTARFLTPETARRAIREFIAACPKDSVMPPSPGPLPCATGASIPDEW